MLENQQKCLIFVFFIVCHSFLHKLDCEVNFLFPIASSVELTVQWTPLLSGKMVLKVLNWIPLIFHIFCRLRIFPPFFAAACYAKAMCCCWVQKVFLTKGPTLSGSLQVFCWLFPNHCLRQNYYQQQGKQAYRGDTQKIWAHILKLDLKNSKCDSGGAQRLGFPKLVSHDIFMD